MPELINFPIQTLPFNRKDKQWRKQCMDWADSKTFFNYSLVRNSVMHKKINQDLLNGKLHMSDMELILNPDGIQAGYIPDKIQHYPIMLSKLNVLRGEELNRAYDMRVIVTNPNAISEKEKKKKEELFASLQSIIASSSADENEFNQKLQEINEYYSYDWQDLRELRANSLLNHYIKEYNIPQIFNNGFMDAMSFGEEIYQVDIVGGEPVINTLNPMKVRAFKSGYSNKIEDADIIMLEDYWSPAKVIDVYYDVLSKKDINYIEKLPDHVGQGNVDSMDNLDERYGFVNVNMISDEITKSNGSYLFDPADLFTEGITNSLLPYDLAGNLRVIRLFWKSRRRIKRVKSYDPETGEVMYNFYPENHKINKDLGEEEIYFYINEAWEGTKIGENIYVNMRPRPIQYNRLGNPSRCHFGIIGSVYNLNDSRPFSLVDMMKPYNYMYNAVHDRLNKAIANNWGTLLKLDFAKVPKGWTVEKWLYYAKVNRIAVEDSFKEGEYGNATGKLAGGLNNNSSGTINTNTGDYIQQHINLLEFLKMEMAEIAGITRQREGQISNRETVGGVERATLQSSHITEWLFSIHEDVKKRVLEAFLETAKIALRGKNKKFQYLLSDNSLAIMDIDGDEFSEADYGILVDNTKGAQDLKSEIHNLALGALQNQTISFSTVMKLYSSSSLAEKQRLIQKDEREIQERNAQNNQAQLDAQREVAEMQMSLKQQEIDQKTDANIRDNETKLLIERMKLYASEETSEDVDYSAENRAKLLEEIRQFDKRLEFDKEKHKDTMSIEKRKLNKTTSISK